MKLEVGSWKLEASKRDWIFLLLLTSIFHLPTFNYSWAQPTGASFLKIPVGARAGGVGSAFSALVDDASGLYWNPSGIARIGVSDLLASHNIWIADTTENFVGFAQRIGFGQVVGVSLLSLTMDPMEGRNDFGQRTEFFRAEDRALALSWALSLEPRISLGVTVKQINQTIGPFKASGRAFDFGFQARAHRRLSLGVSLLHAGEPLKFINEIYALPTTLRVGLGLRLGQALVVTAEALRETKDRDIHPDFGFGLEYSLSSLERSYFWSPVVWRLGYFSPNGAGVGVGLRVFGTELDYALAPMGELGLTHRISFNLKLGKSRSRKDYYQAISSVSKQATISSKKATTNSGDSPMEKKKTGTILDFLLR